MTNERVDNLIAVIDKQDAEIKRLSRPWHEREPPHCATCGCGVLAEFHNLDDLAEIKRLQIELDHTVASHAAEPEKP